MNGRTFTVLAALVVAAVLVGMRGFGALWSAVPTSAPRAEAAAAGGQRFLIVPGESQVIYRVGETLISEGNRFNVAVGVTRAVRGEVVVDRTNPAASRVGTISVDISQFQSDSSRRDNAIRGRWLESSRYPIAEFVPTRIDGLPAQYVEGRDIALRISGNLKVRTEVQPTTFEATVRLAGNELRGTAAAKILMTDFGFEPPSILGILRAQNEVEIEFRFVARPAP
jgi:polyisoprenoid-binding protein YceI